MFDFRRECISRQILRVQSFSLAGSNQRLDGDFVAIASASDTQTKVQSVSLGSKTRRPQAASPGGRGGASPYGPSEDGAR